MIPNAPNAAGSNARAFVRVRLYNPDSKAELTLPHFPAMAPDFGEERR